LTQTVETETDKLDHMTPKREDLKGLIICSMNEEGGETGVTWSCSRFFKSRVSQQNQIHKPRLVTLVSINPLYEHQCVFCIYEAVYQRVKHKYFR